MALQEKAPSPSQTPWNLYVHVPFCASTCDFCAFYQQAPERAGILAYLDGIARERQCAGLPPGADTVFVGGGTPGVLTAGDLERLGGEILQACQPGGPSEWTIELAPSTVKDDKLRALRAAGVNRVSLGVQSFSEELMRALGRRQSPRQAREAYGRIRRAGFDNVNLDLIFAIPGQDTAAMEADLREALALEPDHLSLYCLTFEEDTVLYTRLCEGKVQRDADAEADLYERAWDLLEAAGLRHYEVSNFARPGRECRHNVNTWRMGQWYGLGPSAASQWRGRRFANVADLEQWRAGLERGEPSRVDEQVLDAPTLLLDRLVFGLRMDEGVALAELHERFGPAADGVDDWPLWQPLLQAGLLRLEHGRILLTRAGRLLADRVGASLLEARATGIRPAYIKTPVY
jgi:oxygen-independent coproporphyrinogen-3 oxidase